MNTAISELRPELDQRPSQGRSESRQDLYEAVDRPALKPLPAEDYEYAEWRRAKPGIDYHAEVDKRFYSVPHALVGHRLDLRITATTVEVMHKGKRVASHAQYGQGRFSTQTPHMPESHQAHREWSPGRFLNWAADIGPCTATTTSVAPATTTEGVEDHVEPTDHRTTARSQAHRHARGLGATARAAPDP